MPSAGFGDSSMRDARRGKGRTTAVDAVPIKTEDGLHSETQSPSLPLIEISEVNGVTDTGADEATMEDELLAPESNDSVKDDGEPGNDVEMTDPEVKSSLAASISEVMQEQSTNTPEQKGRPRRSAPVSPVQTLAALGDESMQSESSSQEGPPGSTRRPREAHKRLKLVGGYYRKLDRQREEERMESATATPARDLNGLTSSSRGTSSVPEEAHETMSIVDEDRGNVTSSDNHPGPSTPSKPNKQETTLTGSLRRMNNAPLVHSSPNKLMHVSGEEANTDSNEGGNNEYCETCGGVGHFICCDGCPRSFHFACINPPLDIDELPSTVGDENDIWYCKVCRAAKKPIEKGKGSRGGGHGGVFGPLLKHVDEENPSIFALPLEIRNYFKGVATANDGSYVNSLMLRTIKVNKFGIVDEREPLRLKDKNGKPILCFRCGESAMPPVEHTNSSSAVNKEQKGRPSRAAAIVANAAVTSSTASSFLEEEGNKKGWRKMISCDFCSLHWHLDCLDPPLATMPSLSRRWMCPNHIEHVLPSERIPKSVANSTSVQDLPIPSKETIGPGKHYRMRVVNDGQIDIIPDPMDTYTGPSNDGGNHNSNNKNGSAEKGWEEQEAMLPAYKGYPSVFGAQNNFKFKYRVPEKIIRLDFWSKAELEREKLAVAATRKRNKSSREGLDLLAVVANAFSIETSTTYQQAEASSSSSSKGNGRVQGKPMSEAEAEKMVDCVLSTPTKEVNDHPFVKPGEEPVSLLRQSYIPGEYEREFEGLQTEPETKKVVSPQQKHVQLDMPIQEADQLQAIQRLIAYKGKDALLDFLLH